MLIWFDAVSILSGSSFDIYIHILISFLSIGYFDFETLQKKKKKRKKNENKGGRTDRPSDLRKGINK